MARPKYLNAKGIITLTKLQKERLFGDGTKNNPYILDGVPLTGTLRGVGNLVNGVILKAENKPTVALEPVADTTATTATAVTTATGPTGPTIKVKYGIGEALLDDPKYGPQLREIKRVLEIEKDEGKAADLYLNSLWGQLDSDAQANYLLKLEKSNIYQERLRSFLIRIKKSLAQKNLTVSDEKLEQYFIDGIDDATILDDAISAMSLDTKDEGIIQGEPGAALDILRATARANGFNFDTDFADQKNDWLQRILRGEDVENFKRLIRNNAKFGMSENVKGMLDEGLNLADIYRPYRNAMATLLETPLDSIKLDDPVLQSALSGDKEMTLSDFKRAIRKDTRWQYTDNARQEVSNSVLSVLRDFGFQG